MITFTDPDYLRAKRYKLGWSDLEPAYQELKRWIADRFAITEPLYIEHEYCALANSPRLQVVFEHRNDADSFYDDIGNYDAAKQAEVATAFRRLLVEHGDDRTDLDGMFIIFAAFEPVAREEANAKVAVEIDKIQQQIGCSQIWTISSLFDVVAVFFETDQQLAASQNMPIRQRCRDIWMEHLLPYDEFGYFARRPIEMRFDSRESLNRNFAGNLFFYWK